MVQRPLHRRCRCCVGALVVYCSWSWCGVARPPYPSLWPRLSAHVSRCGPAPLPPLLLLLVVLVYCFLDCWFLPPSCDSNFLEGDLLRKMNQKDVVVEYKWIGGDSDRMCSSWILCVVIPGDLLRKMNQKDVVVEYKWIGGDSDRMCSSWILCVVIPELNFFSGSENRVSVQVQDIHERYNNNNQVE
ncbi:uncharacterized protein [Spinacia oleracea]|uniref:Uncharacterized protein isoform X3 n=1 Tax=Spinacia oleracea TaxID=3562 RepID=A0ABM3QVT8_SPIOL|nr:uncharacterized protein LOC110804527 isoform X3 [Spinacia oleracea]